MNRFFSLRSAGALLVAGLILSFPVRASAEVRPHFSQGTAKFVSPLFDFVGTGNATHLGLYSEVGRVSFSPTNDGNILQIDGCAIYTAANGDKLRAVISGRLNRLTGAITATLRYSGGTGRFAGATGSASLVGQLLPNGTVTVAVNGSINY